MIELLIKAIGLGLALVIMIGPVFFSLIQTSIEKGSKAGILMAVGISLSDAFYVFICYMGLIRYISNYSHYTGIIGGSVLILFGIYSMLKVKSKINLSTSRVVESKVKWKYIVKGFLINFVNPFVIIFWLATVSAISAQYVSTSEILLFFSIVILFVLTTDIIKSLIANRLRRLITVKFIKIMNFLVGLILTGLGIRLLFVSPEVLQF